MCIVGIDLAGSEKRPTGLSILAGKQVEVFIVYTNKRIIETVKKVRPELIAIDAPLSLPKGRKSIDEKNNIHFRECDLELRRLRIRFFPITLGPMRMLTKRGMKLKKKLKTLKTKVIEVYPGATYDIYGVKRKNKKDIITWIKKMGFFFNNTQPTYDELDAVTCAITGALYLKGRAACIGKEDGNIIIPISSSSL